MRTFNEATTYALIVALERALDFYKRNWKEWAVQDHEDVSALEDLLKSVEKPKVGK